MLASLRESRGWGLSAGCGLETPNSALWRSLPPSHLLQNRRESPGTPTPLPSPEVAEHLLNLLSTLWTTSLPGHCLVPGGRYFLET